MDFRTFWVRYPRRVAKAEALKAWKKLTPKDAAAALEALDAHVDHWRGTDKQFIPYPASWLRGRRWEDELETRMDQMSDHEYFRIHGISRRQRAIGE